MAGIRDLIKSELNLTGGEHDYYSADAKAEALIIGYSESNMGHVNPRSIINDIKTTAENIVDHLPLCVSGYDWGHEINECGKWRECEAIRSLGGNLADECLSRQKYGAYEVGAWSGAIYDEAKNVFEERAFGNGIEGYREYVREIPYGNIHSVTEALGEQTETVKFLAENGDSKDFRDFMIDVRPNAETKYPDEPFAQGDYGVTVHGCPRELSDRIFDSVKNMTENGTFSWFDRDSVMKGLSAIHNEKTMSDDEKYDLQNDYIENRLDHRVSPLFEPLLKTDIENKYEAVSSFLKESNGLSAGDQDELVFRTIIPDAYPALEEKYESLVSSLKEDNENGTLTLHDISEKIKEAGFNEILEEHDAGYDILLNTYTEKLAVEGGYCKTTHNDFRITIDANELSSIVHGTEDRIVEKDTEKIESAEKKGNLDSAERWGDTWVLHTKDDSDDRPVIFREGDDRHDGSMTVRTEKLDSNGGIRYADTRVKISEDEAKTVMDEIKSLSPDRITEHDVTVKEDLDECLVEYSIDGKTVDDNVKTYLIHPSQEVFERYCADHPEKMEELAESGLTLNGLDELREYVFGSDMSISEFEDDLNDKDHSKDVKDYDIQEDDYDDLLEDYTDDFGDFIEDPVEIFTLEMSDDEDSPNNDDDDDDGTGEWCDPID